MNSLRVTAMSAAVAALVLGARPLGGQVTAVTFKTTRNVAFL